MRLLNRNIPTHVSLVMENEREMWPYPLCLQEADLLVVVDSVKFQKMSCKLVKRWLK